ncbi:ArsR family transcriptional regulator [Acinetobacter marinus]|uniref:ArsR family transcriptional regulator n=1 Tax=Acinetobacter marinus TaxID=281375 RepID=A0A1G6P7G8_9GAMM|nr:metalloregulator ArsR/SmtB family transcription factor [Acinetobacter marinus]SDC76093.1 ArsR family transcriptional regulator [Acinetobacter marinus]
MDQVNFFKCLSDETRLNIVTLIAENKELCVCDLTEKLQLSQPKISRHLALLRASGLLQDRRQGQWVYYSINPKLANWCYEILDILKTVQSQSKLDDQHPLSVNSYCE